jgi:hypothetical protein
METNPENDPCGVDLVCQTTVVVSRRTLHLLVVCVHRVAASDPAIVSAHRYTRCSNPLLPQHLLSLALSRPGRQRLASAVPPASYIL